MLEDASRAPRSTDVVAIRGLLERIDPAPASTPNLTEQESIELLRELEDLKAAAAGAQASVTAHLARSRADAEQAAGVPARKRCAGLASEVALARRVSPHRGGQHLGLARALDADMPHALAALRAGHLSEWRATLLVRETICLDAATRRAVDRELCADPDTLAGLGDQRLVAEAKKVAYRLDPHSVVDRARRAERERSVTVRPAPDTMAYLTALLPVAQAVAVHAALSKAAESARAAGDERGRGQLMADTLVALLTGTDAQVPAQVQLQLVMSDRSLLAGGSEPAQLRGLGTVAADWARDLVARALREESGCGVWLRRTFTDPAGRLIAMESRERRAPAGLAHYITTRDGGICRTSWCDAPVRHIDHVRRHAAGGRTREENLQGLCEQCNYTKDAAGWHASPAASPGDPPGDPPDDPPGDPPETAVAVRTAERPADRQRAPRAGPTIHTRTPTGHRYPSPTPRLPRTG